MLVKKFRHLCYMKICELVYFYNEFKYRLNFTQFQNNLNYLPLCRGACKGDAENKVYIGRSSIGIFFK